MNFRRKLLTETDKIDISGSYFSCIRSNENGGVIRIVADSCIGNIERCFFTQCGIYNYEGGAIYINNGVKYALLCSTFVKNGAHCSPNLWISNRNVPFPNRMENLQLSDCLQDPLAMHLDIFGGNPLNFKNNSISNNIIKDVGVVCDYFIAQRRDQFAFCNFADNNLVMSYFIHDQNLMPLHLYYDKINFIRNAATNFLFANSYEKYDEFFDTNFIQTTRPVFNKQVTFHNSYFSFSMDVKQSATLLNCVQEPVIIVLVYKNCIKHCKLSQGNQNTSNMYLLHFKCSLIVSLLVS